MTIVAAARADWPATATKTKANKTAANRERGASLLILSPLPFFRERPCPPPVACAQESCAPLPHYQHRPSRRCHHHSSWQSHNPESVLADPFPPCRRHASLRPDRHSTDCRATPLQSVAPDPASAVRIAGL